LCGAIENGDVVRPGRPEVAWAEIGKKSDERRQRMGSGKPHDFFEKVDKLSGLYFPFFGIALDDLAVVGYRDFCITPG
jgi:hypothetical protein